MTEDKFSAREVAVLIELLRSEFRVVSEAVISLREDVADLKIRMLAIQTEIRSIKDVIRVAIPDIYRRLSIVESKVL